MSKIELDARHLFCPMPVIKVQNTIKSLQANDELMVYCTDPGAQYDVPAWCRVHGHQLLDIQKKERDIIIHIKVNKGA